MKTTRQKLFLCQQLTHWHRTRHLRPVWSRWAFHLPFPEGCPPPPCVLPHSLPVLGAEPSPSSGTRSLYRAHKHTFTHHIYDFYSFSQAFCVRIITYFCWYSLISLLALLYFLSRVWYWDWVSFRCSSTAWKQHTHTHKQTQSGSENNYIWVIINPLVDWDVKWWGNYFIQSWLIVASWHLAFLNKLPYTETVPPSNSPPVSPSSLYCPGCFAPTERAPSANATYPAPREPAGGKGWECGRRRWYVGGRASVKSSFSQQRKLMLC